MTNPVGELVDYVNNAKTMVVTMTREQTLNDPIFRNFPLPNLPSHCPGNHTFTILLPITYRSIEITGTLREVYQSHQSSRRRGFSLGFISITSTRATRNVSISSNVLVEVSSVGICMYILMCSRCGKRTQPFSQDDIVRMTQVERLDHYPEANSINDIPVADQTAIADRASWGNSRTSPSDLWDLDSWVESLQLDQPQLLIDLLHHQEGYTLPTLCTLSWNEVQQILSNILLNKTDLDKIKTGIEIMKELL